MKKLVFWIVSAVAFWFALIITELIIELLSMRHAMNVMHNIKHTFGLRVVAFFALIGIIAVLKVFYKLIAKIRLAKNVSD